MKRVPLSEVKDDLSRYVQLSAHEDIVVTRHGRPAAVLIGFEDEEDWFDYQLEHDPWFILRMDAARLSFEVGRGMSMEEVRTQLGLSRPEGRKRTVAKLTLRRKRLVSKKRQR